MRDVSFLYIVFWNGACRTHPPTGYLPELHVFRRRIEVTFVDGELMVGTTLGYRPDGTGFFVRLADTDGNNFRVFVAPGAVKRVRFL